MGLVVQPLEIVHYSFILKGRDAIICSTLVKVRTAFTTRCVMTSFNHLLLLSAERYLAIKHPFAYENLVTETRIIVASGLSWSAAILFPMEESWPPKKQYIAKSAVLVMQFISISLLVYLNVSVYREVRRNENKIIANQVSLEVKEKLLKNKKAFYCTIIVLLAIFLCYFPANIIILILISFMKDSISINVTHIVYNLVTLLPVLNSLFNPLIYAVRIRYFRVAFIQLLLRKTVAQAEQLEKNMFGPKQVRGVATAQQELENRDSREGEVEQGNENP